MKKIIIRGLIIIVILVAAIYAIILFIDSLSHERTDDAYVAGTIVPVSAEVRGKVVKVYIVENQSITEGAPLLEIFCDDYKKMLQEKEDAISRLKAEEHELQASVEQGRKAFARVRANLEAARAEESMSIRDRTRYENLLKKKIIPQRQYDNIQSNWTVAQARREAAQAASAEAEAAIKTLEARLATQSFKIKEAETSQSLAQMNLARTVVFAPISGRIAMKNVDPGIYVQPGQPLLSIVKTDTWVIANFKETQIGKMSVGQPVQIKVDAYPKKIFKGHIDSIQPGTGAVFSLLPPENSTGNFIKVVQRIPIKIIIDSAYDPAYPLWPGLSVVPTVDVSRRTGPRLVGK